MKGKGKVPAVGGSDDSGDGKGKPSVGGTGQAAVGGKGQLLVFWQEVCHSNPTSRIWRQLAICGGTKVLCWSLFAMGSGIQWCWMAWMDGQGERECVQCQVDHGLGFQFDSGLQLSGVNICHLQAHCSRDSCCCWRRGSVIV